MILFKKKNCFYTLNKALKIFLNIINEYNKY